MAAQKAKRNKKEYGEDNDPEEEKVYFKTVLW
jgi:hypothetical protein